MGIELTDMDMEGLDNILYEVARDNNQDLSTFIELMVDMYGGMDLGKYRKLESFLHNDLNIHSDAELFKVGEAQKRRIVEFLN